MFLRKKKDATATAAKPAITSSTSKKPGRIARLKGKVKSAFKKAVLAGVIATPFLGTGVYNYGTEQTVQATITDIRSVPHRNAETGRTTFSYIIETDKGSFEDNASALHGKFNSNSVKPALREGQTYDLHYYGIDLSLPVVHFAPNLLGARELTPEEIAAREAEQNPPVQPPVTEPTTPPVTDPNCTPGKPAEARIFVDNGNSDVNDDYLVDLLLPCEVKDKITVKTVTPVNPRP